MKRLFLDCQMGIAGDMLTATLLGLVDAAKIGVGAENCADKESGAYTGEVSIARIVTHPKLTTNWQYGRGIHGLAS